MRGFVFFQATKSWRSRKKTVDTVVQNRDLRSYTFTLHFLYIYLICVSISETNLILIFPICITHLKNVFPTLQIIGSGDRQITSSFVKGLQCSISFQQFVAQRLAENGEKNPRCPTLCRWLVAWLVQINHYADVSSKKFTSQTLPLHFQLHSLRIVPNTPLPTQGKLNELLPRKCGSQDKGSMFLNQRLTGI